MGKTNKKLEIRFNDYFKANFEKYYYSKDNWKQLQIIFDSSYQEIKNTQDIDLFDLAISKLNAIEKNSNTKNTKHVLNFKDVTLFLKKMHFNWIFDIFNFTKSFFAVPLLTISSCIIAWPLYLLFTSFFFSFLPLFVTEMHILTIFSSVTFLFLNYYVFKTLYFKKLDFSYRKYLVKYFSSAPFWGLLFLLCNDNTNTLVYVLFSSHLFLFSLYNNIIVFGIINYLINCLIVALLDFLIVRINTKI